MNTPKTPALSESSPKSGSVPAVAGGGEDAKLDEEAAALVLAHALADKEGGDRYRNLRDYNHAQWFMRVTSDMFEAAIAATKAKEEEP